LTGRPYGEKGDGNGECKFKNPTREYGAWGTRKKRKQNQK